MLDAAPLRPTTQMWISLVSVESSSLVIESLHVALKTEMRSKYTLRGVRCVVIEMEVRAPGMLTTLARRAR